MAGGLGHALRGAAVESSPRVVDLDERRRKAVILGGLEGWPVPGHIGAMRKKPWKLIAYVEGADGKSGSQEYFLVRDVDRYAAIAALLKSRPDLENSRVEVKGGASPDFLDWIQPDKDVFSIMVVS